MEREIETRHLQGISDLTLLGTIKPGLVSALDTRSYASRVRAVLKTLHTLRQTAREQSLVRPFSDATDRIRTITDLRMAILEDEQKLLLSVSFDRPWEPYLRIIWRDVGMLLDLIFCNCVGYPISFRSSFAEYGRWIRDARTNTQFFYRASALSFDDVQYLRQTERLLRDVPPPAALELEAAKLVADDPERIAQKTARDYFPHAARQGMQALSVLYRLADLYPAETGDDEILLRAGKELLRELALISPGLPPLVRQRFAAQLAWIEAPLPACPAPVTPPLRDTGEVQGGILSEYAGVTHGAVLLLSVASPAAGADFLASLRAALSTEGGAGPADGIYVNVGLTVDGLRALGLSDAQIGAFPHDFREGMEHRAGLIGDVRGNHPRHWALPEHNWPARRVDPATGCAARVPLSTVHVVVPLRKQSDDPGHELIAPLRQKIDQLLAGHANVTLLSVQPTRRYLDPSHGKPREHFGFIDGISQPVVGQPAAGPAWSNLIGPGELLLGYENDRGDAPARDELLDHGSFLVIRKLRQDVKALNDAIQASGIAADTLKAKMMGRTVDGDPLAAPGSGNAFEYAGDDGSRCPFAAHIRRANPRTKAGKDGRATVPRIMRRGMSYGPRFEDDPATERGLLFMAYNASLSEQFEVIQRWLSGGNSTGVLSEQSDPLLGVPQLGETRTFRYHDGSGVKRVKLDDRGDNPSRPFVRLEWGLYLFAPSKAALAKLEEIARASARPSGPAAEVVAQGERIIAALREREARGDPAIAEAWKSVLEDGHARSSGESEAVWAAIRERHGGVLRTPYGVLVASKALVNQVWEDVNANCSVSGYVPRLHASIGEMYLGLDDDGAGSPYRKQSAVTNAAIMGVTEREAFELARSYAKLFLSGLIQVAKGTALATGERTWELTFDTKEVSDYALAKLCEEWVGPLEANGRLKAGGFRWDWKEGDPPFYPGHFTAPSRYVFQPNPGPGAETAGQKRGKALHAAMKLFVSDHRTAPPAKKLSAPMFADPELTDDDLLARTLVGILIGFLPTVEGNFRATLNEWLGGATLRLTLNERLDPLSFWDLQNAYITDAEPDAYAKALKHLRVPLARTMQLRPAPEVGWRTACSAHRLGDVEVQPGDTIVIGIVSATQEDLAADRADVFPIFGGNRRGTPQPTHACPGYAIGMGTLLGMIAAIMEMGPVQPTPAPLSLSLRGDMP